MRKNAVAVVALTLLATSPALAQKLVRQSKITSVPAATVEDTTGMFQARYGRVGDDFFIGGQPTEKALRDMKAKGVTTVINLRTPPEMERIGFDEKALIESLGMKYVYIPLRTGSTTDMAYSPAALAKFSEAMSQADGKVLLHCTIAWRASHIWGAYLIQQGVPDSLAVLHTRAINLMDEHRMDTSGQQPIEMFLGRKVKTLGHP